MKELFSIIDTSKSKISIGGSSLKVNDNSPYLYKIYRLFTGRVLITSNYFSKSVNIKEDYLGLYLNSQRHNFYHKLASYWSDELTLEKFSIIIGDKKIQYQNIEFFRQLFNEICSYHFALKAHNYTKSFVHIYRVLELIAYAFPMIYTIRTKEFKGSYQLLKQFLDNKDVKGELGFLKKSLEVIYGKDSDISRISIDIDLRSLPLNLIDPIEKAYRNTIDTKWIHDDTTENILAIKFLNVGSAIINLRNRTFHNLNNSSNLHCHHFIDLDLFYKNSITPFFSWIGILYLEILRTIYGIC